MVKLPRDFAQPHVHASLSGGQKQRIGIARASAASPALSSRTTGSALDASAGGGDRAADGNSACDSARPCSSSRHDLSVVRYLADRVVVMYLGQIMEQGKTDEIYSPPYHPYTEALLSAVPIADTP